jgi:hypothetical protein
VDRKLQAETLSFVLLLVAFPITSWGAVAGNYVIWWIGFLCLIAGGLLPIVTRFMDHSGDKVRDVGMEFDDRTS